MMSEMKTKSSSQASTHIMFVRAREDRVKILRFEDSATKSIFSSVEFRKGQKETSNTAKPRQRASDTTQLPGQRLQDVPANSALKKDLINQNDVLADTDQPSHASDRPEELQPSIKSSVEIAVKNDNDLPLQDSDSSKAGVSSILRKTGTKSKIESLECFDLLEWWVGDRSEEKNSLQMSASCERLRNAEISIRSDPLEWLDRFIKEWAESQADRFSSSGVNLSTLNSIILSLASMLEWGDGLNEHGALCCRHITHSLRAMINVLMNMPFIASHDVSYILSLIKTCTDLVVRMAEYKRFVEADSFVDLSHTTAILLFRRRPADQPDSAARLQEASLVSACSNASAYYLRCGRTQDALDALEQALPFVRDELEDAPAFYLNHATVLDIQGKAAAADKQAAKALALAEQRYDAELSAEAVLQAKLGDLQQQLDAARPAGDPDGGPNGDPDGGAASSSSSSGPPGVKGPGQSDGASSNIADASSGIGSMVAGIGEGGEGDGGIGGTRPDGSGGGESRDGEEGRRPGGVLPGVGKPFYVRCEDGNIQYKSDEVFLLEQAAAETGAQIQAQGMRASHCGWMVLRASRKLGALRKVAAAGRGGGSAAPGASAAPAAALRPHALRVLELEGRLAMPVPDVMGNASFLADYYFLSARACKQQEARRALLALARDTCLRGVGLAKSHFGADHAWERSAELHEKAAIAMMLLGNEGEPVLILGASAVRIRRAHDPSPRYLLARSLSLLSETLAYVGELDQALEAATQGERMCAMSLGELHYKTRLLRQALAEHRKMAAAIFLRHRANKSTAAMMARKLDTRAWMDEWLF